MIPPQPSVVRIKERNTAHVAIASTLGLVGTAGTAVACGVSKIYTEHANYLTKTMDFAGASRELELGQHSVILCGVLAGVGMLGAVLFLAVPKNRVVLLPAEQL